MELFESNFGNERLQGGALAHTQLKSISEYSQKTSDLFEPTDDIPDWVQVQLAELQKGMRDLFQELDAQTFARLEVTNPSTGEVQPPEPVNLLFDDKTPQDNNQPTPPSEINLLDSGNNIKTKKKEESETEEDETK